MVAWQRITSQHAKLFHHWRHVRLACQAG
jgi:hypothetical protein